MSNDDKLFFTRYELALVYYTAEINAWVCK